MAKFIPAKCPNCGGAVEFPPDRDTMYCIYCGTNIVMEKEAPRDGGVLVSGDAGNILKLADELFAMGNHDEALGYYNRALELDVRSWRAWLGRGRAQGWSSGPAYFRIDEMFKSYKKASHFAPKDSRGKVEEIKFSYISEMIDHFTSDDYLNNISYDEFRLRISFVLDLMESINGEYPKDVKLVRRAVKYCDKIYDINEKYYHMKGGAYVVKNQILRRKSFFEEKLKAFYPPVKTPKQDEEEVSFFETTACLVIYIAGTLLFVILIVLISYTSC